MSIELRLIIYITSHLLCDKLYISHFNCKGMLQTTIYIASFSWCFVQPKFQIDLWVHLCVPACHNVSMHVVLCVYFLYIVLYKCLHKCIYSCISFKKYICTYFYLYVDCVYACWIAWFHIWKYLYQSNESSWTKFVF